jgi:hypothetical protein
MEEDELMPPRSQGVAQLEITAHSSKNLDVGQQRGDFQSFHAVILTQPGGPADSFDMGGP